MNNYLLTLKEGLQIELKAAINSIPTSIYETISSFANTMGGDIYLGIKENNDGPNEILGISSFEQYKTNILNTIHNKTKISYQAIKESDITQIVIDNKEIIKIHVNEAPINIKPVYINDSINLSYGRDYDGDYVLSMDQIRYYLSNNTTDSHDMLANSYGFDFDTVNLGSLKNYRKEINTVYPNNIYIELDDYSFLKKIGALVKNEKGDFVLTNAAVLMFTSYDNIIKIYPSYLLDYTNCISGNTKWDNRIVVDEPTWSGNVFDFYTKTISDISKNIPSSYYSENGKNIGFSLMIDAMKEALCNALSNHSFFLNMPLKISRTKNQISFRNSGKMMVGISKAILGGISKPRNKSIISFFRRIGIADRTGSGIPLIFEATKKNSFNDPKLTENPLPEENTLLIISFIPKINNPTISTDKIIEYIDSKGVKGASINEITSALNLSRTLVSTICNDLLKTQLIVDNGKKTKGRLFYISLYKQ